MITHADDYVSNLPVFPCLVSLVTEVDDALPNQEILLNLLHKSPILQSLELSSVSLSELLEQITLTSSKI